MSGDVQPRNRKSKNMPRRRHNDEASHGVHITKMGSDDVHLHVQEDHGTGGSKCAKVFFFFCFATLMALFALIWIESHNSTQVYTPLSKSRFSSYFAGWVDEYHEEHDDHDEHDAVGLSGEEHDHDDHDDEPFEEENEQLDESDEDHDEIEDEDLINDDNVNNDDDEDVNNDEDEDVIDDDDEVVNNDDDDDDEVANNDDDDEVANNDDDEVANNVDDEDVNNDKDEDDNDEDVNNEDDAENEDANDDASQQLADEDVNEEDVEENIKEDGEEISEDKDDDDDDDEAFEEEDDDIEPVMKTQTNAESVVYEEDDDDVHFVTSEYAKDQVDDDPYEAGRYAKAQEKQKQQEIPVAKEGKQNPAGWLSSDIRGKQKTADEEEYEFNVHVRTAEELTKKENHEAAIIQYNRIAELYPHKPRAFLLKAKKLDSITMLGSLSASVETIKAYKRYLAFDELIVENDEFYDAAKRAMELMREHGHFNDAMNVHEQTIRRFKNDPWPLTELAVTYLYQDSYEKARDILKEIVQKYPLYARACLLYGLSLKFLEENLTEAVKYMHMGLQTTDQKLHQERFYFHLGDALQRLNRHAEAKDIFKKAAKKGLFLSANQRSLYNIPGLRAKPIWSKKETDYEKEWNMLETNWKSIRSEAFNIMESAGFFMDEPEKLKQAGKWTQLILYAQGKRNQTACAKTPITCSLIDKFPAALNCQHCSVKFSVLHPGTIVRPHCGPTNTRLRAHLGLFVPTGAYMMVLNNKYTWTEGTFLIFDDSFEHSVQHDGNTTRLILIVDVLHPDININQYHLLENSKQHFEKLPFI